MRGEAAGWREASGGIDARCRLRSPIERQAEARLLGGFGGRSGGSFALDGQRLSATVNV